ncbi:hypothetical protein E3U43_001167 [Larimichthys crocea]|uniref:Uncharacterized protein n=1 Tax=Larimichthys crocea TaxID=215358 RepID=A0ACD3RCE3_LARCR|nr:hypothetical protein E3U43_001167 [Larimichthys crocea]
MLVIVPVRWHSALTCSTQTWQPRCGGGTKAASLTLLKSQSLCRVLSYKTSRTALTCRWSQRTSRSTPSPDHLVAGWFILLELPRSPPALPLEHHSMVLCKDLEPYVSLIAELEKEKEEEDDKGAEQKEQCDKAENDSTETSEDCTSVGRCAAATYGFQQHSLLLPLQPPGRFPHQQGHCEPTDQPSGEGLPTWGGSDQGCSVSTRGSTDQH